MASSRVEWSVLRGTLVVFVLCLVVAAAMVTASHYFRERMEREYQLHHAEFREASRKYLAVDDEERIIGEYLPAFRELYESGRLGRERRLSWLETLRRAGETAELPQLTWKLEAQRAATPDFSLPLDGYRLNVSPMSLTLGLHHEGELLRLFEALDDAALGQYSVRRCALRRTGEGLELGAHDANLNAECLLEWWTLTPAGGVELAL